jgi:hypothetical protein
VPFNAHSSSFWKNLLLKLKAKALNAHKNFLLTDGGEGHVGTLCEVGRSGSTHSPEKTVVVNWDSGHRWVKIFDWGC